MVELLEDRLERRLDLGEIHHPTAMRAHLATDVQLDRERMSVQARALVPRRHVRQPMRGFDAEDLEDVHVTPRNCSAVRAGEKWIARAATFDGLEQLRWSMMGGPGIAPVPVRNLRCRWWLWVDSNHRPQHYECCALTG